MTNALETAKAIVKIDQRTQKPILCCFMGIFDVSAGVKVLQEHGLPVYRFPEHAAKAFGALYRYSSWLNRQKLAQFFLEHDKEGARRILEAALAQNRTFLTEWEGAELLRCYGFQTLPSFVATTQEEAVEYAESLTFPVAMKIVSPQILHKSDAKGVRLHVSSAQEVAEAFDSIVADAKAYNPQAEIVGVLVQKMAPAGEEVILGMTRYPVFGPMLMFGLGGIFVEVFKDVDFRVAPIGRNEARRMIRGIRGYDLLKGVRGRPEADTGVLERYLVSLSNLVLDHPEIKELDMNPVMVHPKGSGATVADVRVILEPLQGS
ncbi:acetate--CoA ligase family protein [Desulfosoma sp.]